MTITSWRQLRAALIEAADVGHELDASECKCPLCAVHMEVLDARLLVGQAERSLTPPGCGCPGETHSPRCCERQTAWAEKVRVGCA